jgi:hypothetical protein
MWAVAPQKNVLPYNKIDFVIHLEASKIFTWDYIYLQVYLILLNYNLARNQIKL